MEIMTNSDEMSVGVKILDCDHREMTEALYELQSVVATDVDPRRTGTLLSRLADFTITHFALEEGMMAATKYPELARHRRNHQRIIEHVQVLLDRHNRGAMNVDGEALDLLFELHNTHIQNDDRRYGAWLNESGKR
jgi:hemerythrin